MEKKIRLLKASEIECRVATINEKGLSLLLFKDARVDQKILDETFTPFGWKRAHQSIDGNLYCTVEIWDEGKGQWIGKQDVGTMSYSEKEKGQASDSFKRACFNWGIGRELYTAPFIWIPAGKAAIQKKGDKYVTAEHFSVGEIAYNSAREITLLTILNSHNAAVYALNGGSRGTGQDDKSRPGKEKIALLEKELARTGVDLKTVLERYHLQELGQMSDEIYESAMNGLKKSRTRKAA